MNSFSIADELDQAVSNVLAGVETAGVNTDLEIGELAGIALELSDLPEPVFKAQLKAQLAGHTVTEFRALDSKILALRDKSRLHTSGLQSQPEILPSLFRAASDGYPLHQRNMAASLFMHVTALALVVVAGVWASHDQPVKNILTTHTITFADYPLPPGKMFRMVEEAGEPATS